jgi:uncharacterized protein YggE
MTMADGITVTGHGVAAAPPDVVRLLFASEASDASVQTALDRATDALVAMREALGRGGVDEVDLRSTEASLWSRSDHPDSVVRHTARFGLEATVHSVGTAGRLISAALTAAGDAGRMTGMSFAHAHPEMLQAKAREAAMADARAKATQLAELAGRHLGEVREITEGIPPGPPVPLPRSAIALAADTVPVSEGQLEVSSAVTVRWAWA